RHSARRSVRLHDHKIDDRIRNPHGDLRRTGGLGCGYRRADELRAVDFPRGPSARVDLPAGYSQSGAPGLAHAVRAQVSQVAGRGDGALTMNAERETTVIAFENVTKRFNGSVAVDHLSFTVARGEVLALL